ncbi:ribokinase [Roseibium sp.]|uniref:ribokinase n=1 Tax=Roseibium sp. TaxID=1936156 RepID=UPI003B5296B8
MTQKSGITVLGIFVADTAYYADRLPKIAETIMGSDFTLGPGGKGSNQSVAAARAGAEVNFISRLGKDAFGELALSTYAAAGVTPKIIRMDDQPTGAAFIFVNENNGDNAIIVVAGAAGKITTADVEANRDIIESSAVFVTQLEQPVEAARLGLQIAREAGVKTIFNPAPALEFPDDLFGLCDYIAPNEVEAAEIVGFPINSPQDAQRAGDVLLEKGAKAALITLGEDGALYHTSQTSELVPAVKAGTVIDTTGAGDAFIGGFASALSRDMDPLDAVRFGCATAGIAVTRRGTAPAMPTLAEIEAYL